MTAPDNRCSEIDRRLIDNSKQEKVSYKGPERRSGKDRRVWVDRMHEIDTKLK